MCVALSPQAELEESARTATSTPHSSTLSSLPSPITPLLDQAPAAASMADEDTPLPSPSPVSRLSPKKSAMDIIYSDNRVGLFLSIPDRNDCLYLVDQVKICSKYSFIHQLLLIP